VLSQCLVAKGALRLAERSRAGHVVKVRLPEEIRSLGAGKIAASAAVRPPSAGNIEKEDFLETRALRQAIEDTRLRYPLRPPRTRATTWSRHRTIGLSRSKQ
jgi:hypothetical protein